MNQMEKSHKDSMEQQQVQSKKDHVLTLFLQSVAMNTTVACSNQFTLQLCVLVFLILII